MRTGLAVVTAALLMTACASEATTDDAGSAAASVTQEAPSVWATPMTAADGTVEANKLAAAATTESTLPGLSEECTGAIRAQAAVNDLFGMALTEASRQVSEQNPETAADTADTSEPTPVLQAGDVSSTFDSITDLVPPALATDFAALRKAADAITETAPAEIADVMEESSVTGALTAITDYITDCQPATTDE